VTLLYGLWPPAVHGQTIQSIEINQAIGVQKNGNLKFVAGKDTVVRAFMTSPVSVDQDRTSATVVRDGTVVATLAPNSYEGQTSVVDFLCPSRATCGNWAAGNYVFNVQVNAQTRTTDGTSYRFLERGKLRVLAVPVKTNYNGTILSVANDSWKTLWEFTRSVYPVAHDGLEWTTRDELDASQHNIETDEGKKQVWEALANLNPPYCNANKEANGCFDKIVGFTPARANTYPAGTNQGYTFGPPANIVVASDEDAAATVAHEIAHNYQIGDAYNGGSFSCTANPTPDEFAGTDFDTQEPVRCTAGRVPLAGVGGTLVPASHHPYEVGGRGALPDMAEFMGSGGLQAQFWASQDTYDWIFDRLTPSGASAQSASPRRVRPLAAAAPSQRLLEFSGFIRRNATSEADLDLDAWQSFLDDSVVTDSTGPLMIAAVNAAGQRLATTALSVDFDLPGGKGEPAQHLAEAPFEGVIRFPAGTTAFQIISGGQELAEVEVSANAPVVANVSLGVGSVFNGVTSITWTATDADRDSLLYTVEYNPDVTAEDGYYGVLVADIEDPRWLEDFADLPGGNHARIRVTATDGINSTSAESPEFRVPFKAPDVAIGALARSVVSQGTQIVLDADVEDLQDEALPEAALVWTSDLSGRLGAGEILVVRDLAPGQHTITLTATNSGGVSATDSVSITVVSARRRLP
jgi:hypothetical protein